MSNGLTPESQADSRSLALGVTGHRPDRLAEDRLASVSARLSFVFTTANAWVGAQSTAEVVVSLAEGADRLAARIALAEGCRLHVVLPFERDQFADDFETSESQDEYVRFLNEATWITELHGRRGDEDSLVSAYDQAGAYILRRSNIVVAIWDGHPGRGPGGTADLVNDANGLGLPVIWIEPEPDAAIQFLLPSNTKAFHPFLEVMLSLSRSSFIQARG